MSPSLGQLLLVLAVLLAVVLIFGSKNIRNLGSDLGGFIKGFRTAVKDDTKETQEETETTTTDHSSSDTKS